VLGREVEVREMEERLGEGGRRILLVVMEREEDKNEIMERREEIWGRWKMEVDEDEGRKKVEVEN